MYGIPKNLNLDGIIGNSITQLRIGEYDFQFDIGNVSFSIQSTIKVLKNEECCGEWNESVWPSVIFRDIINVKVTSWEYESVKVLNINLENELKIKLIDDNENFESFQVNTNGDLWVI